MNYQDFIQNAEEKIQSFDQRTKPFNFMHSTVPDHICYKCSNREEFEMVRNFYDEHGEFIYQTEISGRSIATIKLKEPFVSVWGDIDYLELSDQKPDNSQISRWDHIEFKHVADAYQVMIDAAYQAGLDVQEKIRPHHTTHEVSFGPDIKLVFTRELLIDKIKQEIQENT